MLTLQQIKDAHSKVTSGADFPQYVKDLVALGVSHYQTDVSDGHSSYYGEEGGPVLSPALFEWQAISPEPEVESFKTNLSAHQAGKTDYFQFFKDCAKSGVAKWIVDLKQLTCTYFDVANTAILTEAIPV